MFKSKMKNSERTRERHEHVPNSKSTTVSKFQRFVVLIAPVISKIQTTQTRQTPSPAPMLEV